MFLRDIHVVACIHISLPFIAEQCSIVYSLVIVGHLDCFHLLSIMKNDVNICVHMDIYIYMFSFFLDKYLEVEFLSHMVCV